MPRPRPTALCRPALWPGRWGAWRQTALLAQRCHGRGRCRRNLVSCPRPRRRGEVSLTSTTARSRVTRAFDLLDRYQAKASFSAWRTAQPTAIAEDRAPRPRPRKSQSHHSRAFAFYRASRLRRREFADPLTGSPAGCTGFPRAPGLAQSLLDPCWQSAACTTYPARHLRRVHAT